MRVGHIVRTCYYPRSLPEMIARVMRAIDYNSIRWALERSVSSDVTLKRMWQMEFYKAAYRSTPNTVVTSADVGALFGTSGFINFTVHANNSSFFWGIEILRYVDRLEEHIGRFTTGGRYTLLALTDFYLIDFGRIDKISLEKIATDMDLYEKLFVVTFDTTLENVVVLNSKMEDIFKIESSRQP